MIAKLTGSVESLKPTELILDVHGVGYSLSIPIATFEFLRDKNDASLFVYTMHREESMRLFGFHRERDRDIFSMLLSISGIGPAMALSILSGLSIERIIQAVATEDSSMLIGIPGIGKSKADKLIFELKRKQKKLETLSGEQVSADLWYRDAIDALVSLGFEESRSAKIVSEIHKKSPHLKIEGIIKEALKQISG
ncbi:MAG: Holliday junction branch migration protein RuvA [Spirochaetes bacterium]|nr:Holliday junction branch migration protein RuvA [Spirochaetota bacterium]